MVGDDLGWPDGGSKVVGMIVLFPSVALLLQVFGEGGYL